MKAKFLAALRACFLPLSNSTTRIAILSFALVLLFLRCSPYADLNAFLKRPCSTRFYDRQGALVQIIPLEQGLRREYVDIETLPPALIEVFLAAEDERFYYHFGVDPVAIARAAYQNIRQRRRVSGASTITMQLARIISGSSKRNIFSKAFETVNALRLEARFSKKEILSMYLNSIPFGFQAEGIATAARNFFASEPSLLTPAETFCLAVIPRRPAVYNPLVNKQACVNAAKTLASRFANNTRRAAAFPLYASLDEGDWNALRPERYAYSQAMPHLVLYVHSLLRKQSGSTPSDYVLSADLEIQRLAENLLGAQLRRHVYSRLRNGAVIILDNITGEVVAWVGGASYDTQAQGAQIDGVLSKSQMGSSMKPFLYALALENGFTPADVLADIPKRYGTEAIYIPRNFNNRFNGPVLFRTALASSLNIPAVDILYRLGVQNYGNFLSGIGFNLDEKTVEHAGLGLSLGNAPVSLVELAAAFALFPRDGKTLAVRFDNTDNDALTQGINVNDEPRRRAAGYRRSVRNGFYAGLIPGISSNNLEDTPQRGGVCTSRVIAAMYKYFLALATRRVALNPLANQSNVEQVISADTARLICSILSDRGARLLAFGRGTNFETPFPAIFKTGTANQFQSIVALGATTRYTAAVWMGNFTGETVMGRTGSSLPASIVRSLLLHLHAPQSGRAIPAENFKTPVNWILSPICTLSGLAPSKECPSIIEEYVLIDRHAVCSWHRDGSTIYPSEYQAWFLSQERRGNIDYSSAPLEIITPRDNYRFLPSWGSGNSSIPVEVIGGAEDELIVEYNGTRFSVYRPFVFFLPYVSGNQSLTVINGEESDTVWFTAE